jgi:predicted permease
MYHAGQLTRPISAWILFLMPDEGLVSAIPRLIGPLGTILVPCLLGAGLLKLKIIDQKAVDVLTRLVVQVFVPCLIFSKVVGEFRPGTAEYAGWYWMPLVALVSISLVLLMSAGVSRLVCPPINRRPFTIMLGFQNAGYFPLVILAGLYGQNPETAPFLDRTLVLLFLFILGQSPLMWVLSVAIIRKTRNPGNGAGANGNGAAKWTEILTMPFLSSVTAICICLSGAPQRIPPEWLAACLNPLSILGDCAVPVIMISLGGMLASLEFDGQFARREIGIAAIIRLIGLPALAFGLLGFLLAREIIPMAWAVLLFVQTMTPTATNIAVIARRYGSPEASIYLNRGLLILYLACLVTIPIWLAVWATSIGFAPR